jgi:hypothetical protein
MRLKNKIIKILPSDTSSLDKVKNQIIKELNRLNAKNIRFENNKILFKNEFWEFRSRTSLMTYLDSGCFEIVQQDKKILVSFTGYYSFMIELIILLLFISLVVFADPYFGVGCLFVIIGFGSKYGMISGGCSEIMSKIN